MAVAVSPETTIFASVTSESARELGLCVGRETVVLIKAPFMMIGLDEDNVLTSARNSIPGTVARVETSAINAEVVVDIGGGKTLAANISARSVTALNIKVGTRVRALFDAAHVILAID